MKTLHIRYVSGLSSTWSVAEADLPDILTDILNPDVDYVQFEGDGEAAETVVVAKDQVVEYRSYDEAA